MQFVTQGLFLNIKFKKNIFLSLPIFHLLFTFVLNAVVEQMQAVPAAPANAKVVIPLQEETENVTRWIVDQNFRRDQERLKIPFGGYIFLSFLQITITF